MARTVTRTKKHYRIKNKFRFITFCTVFILTLSFSVSAVFGRNVVSGSEVRKYTTVKVVEGDTLWALAKEYGPENVDCRKVIYEITKINGVDANNLKPGQYINIPCEKL